MIKCPKCLFYQENYNAPKGKVVRNPYASGNNPVYDTCDACNGTAEVPAVIIEAIKNGFPKSFNEILPKLRWSIDHYSFSIHGMYVGVELDGYIHT